MRFQEAHGKWSEGRLTQAEAARLLVSKVVPLSLGLVATLKIRCVNGLKDASAMIIACDLRSYHCRFQLISIAVIM